MEDYTPQQLKKWIQDLFDPDTSKEELERNAMTLAHIRQPEALRALTHLLESHGAPTQLISGDRDGVLQGLPSPGTYRSKPSPSPVSPRPGWAQEPHLCDL